MTGFFDLLQAVTVNLQISSEFLIIILFLFPALVFFASDFKIGVISSLIISSGLFIYFYQFGLEFDYVIIIMLLLTVVLAFTLYFVSRKSSASVGVV